MGARVGLGILVLGVACAPVVEQAEAADPSEAIREATISLPGRCAGVVADGGLFAVTAAHCINPSEDWVAIEFSEGTGTMAEVAMIDRRSDIAILQLDQPAPVEGLDFAQALPAPGTPVFFGGRLGAPHPVQDVQVVKLGRCPSLPGVPQALFTSLRGVKGDSGAPVVDHQLRVVGLVHGGAACSIAAPTHEVTGRLAVLDQARKDFGYGGAGSAGVPEADAAK